MTMTDKTRDVLRATGASVLEALGLDGKANELFSSGGLTSAAEGSDSIMVAGSPGRRVAGSPGRRVAGSPGRRVAGSPGRRVAGSPGRRVAGSPGRRVAGSPGRRVAGSPGRRVAGSPGRRVAGSPDRRIAGSPDRRIAGSPDRRIAGSPAMSASGAWLRRLRSRPPSSPPEPSRSAVRRLRPALAAALLSLPLLAGLPTGAQAQVACGTANADGSYPVPDNWALKPSGLGVGAKFRLLFVTSTQRDATATDIATYNTYVQTRAKAGHSAIADSCGNLFKVVGSTSAVDARDNTGTTGTGVPIYWLNGAKVADNYGDFYDGTWDSYGFANAKTESGGAAVLGNAHTGSNADGTKHGFYLGHGSAVRRGTIQSGGNPLTQAVSPPTSAHTFYGLSPVFSVVVAPLAAKPSTVREGGVSFVTVTGFPSSWGAPRIRSLAGATTSLRCDHVTDGLSNSGNNLDVCVGLADGTRTRGHWDGVAYRLTLTVVADGVAENESLTVTFEDSTDTSRTRTAVIALDDRSPLPFVSLEAVVGTNPGNVVSPTPHTVTEGGAFNLRVKMDPWFRLATPVIVNYYLADYHGERVVRGPSLTDPKRDRDPNPRSIEIGAGHSATVIHIPTVASPDLDGDSKVEVILLGGRDYATSTGKLTLTVQDADPVTNIDDNTRAQMLATPSTLTLGADAASVTEGGEVTFTVTAAPAPGYDLPVHLGASEEMGAGLDYIGLERARTVTIPAGATSAAWTVTTWSDDKQRADGTVVARIKPGDGYTAGTPSTVTVALLDDDAPALDPSLVAQVRILAGQTHNGAAHVLRWRRVLVAFGVEAYPGVTAMTAAQAEANARRYSSPLWPRIAEAIGAIGAAGSDPAPQQAATQQAAPAVDPALVALVRSYAAETHNGAAHVERWMRVLAAFGEDNGRAPMTAAEARTYADRGWTRWDPVVVAIAALEAAPEPEPQPVIPPAVSVAAGEAVSEGGGAVFTLTAAPAPASPLAVEVTVGAEGDFGIAAGARTVTVPTSGSLVLTLATVDDGTDEPDGSVSVTLNGGDGYTVGSPASGAVAVTDDDLPPPVVSVTAKAGSITEGAGAVFTVTADRAPDAALAVRLTVSEEAGSDFVAAGDEGGRTVTIPAGTTGVALTVATDDDAADEPDGSVSAAVDAGAGYTVAASPGDTASVAVADNDAAATGASLSVDDATVKEGAGLMWFTLRLSAPSERAVRVSYRTRESSPVSARQGRDYLAAGWHLYFQPGETEKRVWVWVYDDSHDEDPETFEFVLTEATVVPIADGVAVGTIVNDDPLPAAFLARFGRTVAEQALDGIAGRMAAPRTPGMQGTVAGQALNFDPAAGRPAAGATPGATPADRDTALAMADIARGFGADAPAAVSPGGAGDRFGDARAGASLAQSRSMTARDALLGSSFSLTGAADGSGGSLAFWGRASQGSFDGREGTFSLDGTVTTGMLGADYARGKWLVGLALAQSAGEGDYRDTEVSPRPDGQSCPDGADAELCGGAVRAGDGAVEASLTAAIPYAALQVSERLKLWGAAGYGTGEVTLKTALGGSYSSDTSWSMAAAGLRGDLLASPAEGSGPALAVTSDALWTRTSSEKTRDLAASDSDATRLRLGLEGSWRFAMEGGGSLVPKLEIGARHDGGDAETGFGVEIGGGIAWSDPALGLSLDVSGRTLLAHENDDLKDRGYAASLAFDPDPATQRGPSLNLRQEFGGQAQGGLDALFQPATLEDRTGSEAASRWSMEAAYGFPAFGGRWTGSPHVGLGLATGARDYSLGWRLTPEADAPDFSFGLRATRRESDMDAPEHTVGFEVRARW